MSHHPNVIALVQTLVTICKPDDNRLFVYSSLYLFLLNKSLAGHIKKNNESGEQILLLYKAK
jgi:hypothetical protein